MLTKTLAKNIKSLKSSLEFLNQSSYRLKFNAFSHFLKNNFSTETETASKQINIYKIIKTCLYDRPNKVLLVDRQGSQYHHGALCRRPRNRAIFAIIRSDKVN